MQSSGHSWNKKAINSVSGVNNFSALQATGLFSSLYWIAMESAPPPQETFAPPNVKLTLSICQPHLKH